MTQPQPQDIRYVIGDATQPDNSDGRFPIITHICNDEGAWGAGFVTALSRRWPEPEACYRAWHRGELLSPPFELGEVQFVEVSDGIIVANMIAQRSVRRKPGDQPLRYTALAQCLETVQEYATSVGGSVHMPRIGTGLAGGSWEKVLPVIRYYLLNRGVPVTVYDLPGS